MKMALNDLPTIRFSKNGVFLLALPIIFFIFFFTQEKQGEMGK
jgi:hypothetical protein